MIKGKMYERVKALRRQGQVKSEIASGLELDPKTIAKYYAMDEEAFRSYRREHMFRDKVLGEFEPDILEVYEKNEFKKLNMSAVYDYLEERYGVLPANEQSLRNYINYLIQTDKLRLDERLRIYTSVPELPFGKQAQFDFGRHRCRSGLLLFIFAALLSASRYKYVLFQDHPFTTIEVIHHLLDCFDYFGGVPEELVIDQDRLMVVSENSGDIIYTEDFRYFIQEVETGMYVCRKADPETKGKIENLVKYVKGNFLSLRDFETLAEANEGVVKWLLRRANGKISQATKQIPVILIKHEREKLRPVRNSIFRKDTLIGREERKVSEKACISVDACGYQLPSKYRNKTVEIYMTKQKVFVFDRYTGEEIVAYDLSPLPGKIISNKTHTREKDKTIKELKELVRDMFAGDNWQRFTERNFKVFTRYVRDQCLEAKKYFLAKEIEVEILDKALEFCWENDTPSFANLHDTYVYFRRELQAPYPEIGMSRERASHHVPLKVNQRKVAEYSDLIQERVVS